LPGIGKIQSSALKNLKSDTVTQNGESADETSSIELSGEFTSGIFVAGYLPDGSIYVMGEGSVSTFFQASVTTAKSEASFQVDGNLQNSVVDDGGYVTRREDAAILSSFSISSSQSSEDTTS
jgi:hypothetical protein